jgi:myosin-5
VYAAIFAWVVQTLNAKTSSAVAASFIGILDIFGFEQMVENSFEQLCINYANEVLQNLFNTQIFDVERKLYEEDGIDVDPDLFTHHNNTGLVEMLEAKKQGVFSILDEQAMLGDRASDVNFLETLKRTLDDHPSFTTSRSAADKAFVVKHFAGDIEYVAAGFVHKNQVRFLLEEDHSF